MIDLIEGLGRDLESDTEKLVIDISFSIFTDRLVTKDHGIRSGIDIDQDRLDGRVLLEK